MHNLWLDDQTPRADTLLLVSIPPTYRPETGVKHLLRGFRGKIDHVWSSKDCAPLVRKVREHSRVAQNLEAAETGYLRRALEAWISKPEGSRPTTDDEKRRLATTHRRLFWPTIPLWGQKVDEIDYWRAKYLQAAAEADKARQTLKDTPSSGSAFVRFHHPATAHAVRQLVVHHNPGTVIPVCLFSTPEDVVWENVSIDWTHSIYRAIIVKGCMIILVSVFAVPVAIAGTISQITALSSVVPGLSWLESLPAWLLGCIQGVIPPAILACLLWSLSNILRRLAIAHGALSRQVVEEVVQKYYFRFLFAQLFFIIVITSGFVAVRSKIEEGLVATLDSIIRSVPKASNYFLTYLLFQAFSISSNILLQPGVIAQKLIFGPLFDRTPTQLKERAEGVDTSEWGVHFPTYATLACVGFVYSLISPLILFAEVFCFALILVVQRYIIDHGPGGCIDAGGSFYPHAIKQLLSGIYGMQIVLFFLLLLVTNSQQRLACIGQATVVGVSAVCTFFFDRVVQNTFNSLLCYLPASHFPENEPDESQLIHCNSVGGKRKAKRAKESGEPKNLREDNMHLLAIKSLGNKQGGRQSFLADSSHPEARKAAWDKSVFLSTATAAEYPLVRIPRDPAGFSKLEIEDTLAFSSAIPMTDGEVTMDIFGKVSMTF
ncbi:hypothetical protein B0J12DRAFT_586307 [Macrophomina phaseolina]|uniref:CSC1/OSCA1-like 7TM region domain-containing protein n=1 Tax=Macrophomina phaseolina TaxID=35725 RepID=A0ABQ8FRH0_9PEZI|nr:hypothetical protein B0J12DRAFT_586307 [Macrophomina phaseolina]